MQMLKVGQEVIWRGGFGMDAPMKAVVTSIEETEMPRCKHGEPVNEIAWNRKRFAVVTLSNGSWAYGEQLSPIGG